MTLLDSAIKCEAMSAISHRQGNVVKIDRIAIVRNFALSRFGDSPGKRKFPPPLERYLVQKELQICDP